MHAANLETFARLYLIWYATTFYGIVCVCVCEYEKLDKPDTKFTFAEASIAQAWCVVVFCNELPSADGSQLSNTSDEWCFVKYRHDTCIRLFNTCSV